MDREDPIAALDRARATLSRQLAEAEQGRPPTEQLEQFIPAVMAAMPLIRTGVKVVGRDRIKGFLARLLAHDAFRSGALHTGLVDTLAEELSATPPLPEEVLVAAAMTSRAARGTTAPAGAAPAADDPWHALGAWGR